MNRLCRLVCWYGGHRWDQVSTACQRCGYWDSTRFEALLLDVVRARFEPGGYWKVWHAKCMVEDKWGMWSDGG